MEFAIKGRREKERINEIRSKPKPAYVTAKTTLISPSVCTTVQNRRCPPACQSESCHLRPNERSQKSGIDCGTSRPGNPTLRQSSAVSPAANTDHIRCKGKALRSRSVRTRPAQASEPQSQQQGGRNACALPFAVCTNVPVPMKKSHLWHAEGGGSTPRAAIRRTSDHVRASAGTTSPAAAGGTPALCNSQSVRLFRWRRTYSTARFASAIPAAKGRTNTPSSSFWKARFINLFAGKSPPLPFIRRYTIPVVNAA